MLKIISIMYVLWAVAIFSTILIAFHNVQRACHCTDCKQTSGGAFSTSIMVPKRHIHIAGPTKEYTYATRVPNGRIGE